MRLLALIFACFTALALALASVHFWGQGQQYLPFENKFSNASSPWLIVPWEQNFFIAKKKDLVLWANIYASEQDLVLVAPTSEKNLKNREREQNASPARPLLSELLRQFPDQRFVLNVTDNREEILGILNKVLENEKRSERILIQSDFNNVLTSLKDIFPRMMFGSTPADTMRLKSFQSMWILSATPFKGDAFVSPLRLHKKISLNNDIAKELKKRYKKIILGPLENPEDLELALGLGADGLFIEKPEWYLLKSN